MQKPLGVRLFFVCILAAVLAGFCGCDGTSFQDQREDRDPFVKRARARKSAQDLDGAIALYNKALERRPGLARAHLELGLIYDQDLHDDLRAIYHYERYLELRPDAEKKNLVEELILHAKLSFAASLPEKPSEAVREIAMLKQENEALRKELEKQQARVAPPQTQSVAIAREPEPAVSKESPAPRPKAMDSYVVQPGDTLSRIAGKVYNDPGKWELIFNANRGILAGPQSIRVGQTLVIPKQ